MKAGVGVLAAAVLFPAGATAGPVVESTATLPRPAVPSPCGATGSEAYPQVEGVPGRPEVLRTVFLVEGARAAAGAASADGGRTWTSTVVPAATACTGGPADKEALVNPRLSVGGAGAVLGGSWTRVDRSLTGVAAHVWPSPDGPWRAPADLPPSGQVQQDLGVHAHPSRADDVRAAWFSTTLTPVIGYPAQESSVDVAESSDGGRTFAPPRPVHSARPAVDVYDTRLHGTSGGPLATFFEVPEQAQLQFTAAAALSALGLPAPEVGRLELDLMAMPFVAGQWTAPVRVARVPIFARSEPDPQRPGVTTIVGSVKPDVETNGLRAAAVWAEPEHDGTSTIRMATSADGGRTWSPSRDALAVRGQAIQPAVALADDGALGLFWYDDGSDLATGDGPVLVDAWFAVSTDGGASWQRVHLAGPFDLRRSNDCRSPDRPLPEPLPLPVPLRPEPACALLVDAMPIGVVQDAVAIGERFGVAYTVAPPLAGDGFTAVRFARVARGPASLVRTAGTCVACALAR